MKDIEKSVPLKTIAIFCKRFAMGGTETLILRLLEWYSTHNYRAVLLTLDAITDDAILADIKKRKFERYVYNKKENKFLSTTLENLYFNDDEQVLILTQYFPEFFKFISLQNKLKYKCQFRHTIEIKSNKIFILCARART